jgi:hypothetical protein
MAIAGTAVRRAADAMLRALGGDELSLILPLPSTPSDPDSQLGLSDPGVQQLTIAPIVVRNLPANSGPSLRLEILISASAVADAVEAQGASSATDLFNSALGIQIQASLLHIEQVQTDCFAGVAYLYRVTAVE